MTNSIGVDILKIARIEKLLKKWRDKFLSKYFTNKEIKYIKSKGYPTETIAGIFASKEAVSKVLGTGFIGIRLKEIEVNHKGTGEPFINLYGKTKDISIEKNIKTIEVSISHEKDYVISVVIANLLVNRNEQLIGQDMIKILKSRPKESHKGTYGSVAMVSASEGMLGSNYLSSMSSLRTGSGKVYSVVPESLKNIAAIKFIEVILLGLEDQGKGYFTKASLVTILPKLNIFDALGLGPGIGDNQETRIFTRTILEEYKGPIVLDADGINNIVDSQDVLKSRFSPTILTPHPGEFASLLGKTSTDVNENRLSYALDYANKYNIILVLKGHKTIVTDGKEFYINLSGNPGMATAGSGDVLTGIITSLLGQGIDPFSSAKLGVFIHGLAGDLASHDLGEYGMIASDILDRIPHALKLIVN